MVAATAAAAAAASAAAAAAGAGTRRGLAVGSTAATGTATGRRRAVAVTGIGSVNPLAGNFRDSHVALMANRSGVTSLGEALRHQFNGGGSGSGNGGDGANDELERDLELSSQLQCQVAAAVKGDDETAAAATAAQFDLYNPRTTARFVQFALRAADEAIRDAGLEEELAVGKSGGGGASPLMDKSRVGVSIGSGMSSVREVVRAASLTSYRKLGPHFVPSVLSNSASGRVAIRYGLQGPNLSSSTACSAATHAIGDAALCIRDGRADVMLAGGAEAAIDPLSLAGFARLRALSTSYNDHPESASRPFDAGRDGFVMGEGAAILVLEELQRALARGRPVLAVLAGYGASGDGYHITAPDPDGVGARLCMERALEDAGLTSAAAAPEMASVYVNAHATSTPKGDEIEAAAIERVFFGGGGGGDERKGSRCYSPRRVLVSSTKGSTGHLLGAAGAVEAAFAVQALRDRRVPPTLNLERPLSDGDGGDDDGHHVAGSKSELVRGGPVEVDDLEVAVSNSFGFGGTNASLVFRRWDGDS